MKKCYVTQPSTQTTEYLDSCVYKALTDSICDIITNADSITISQLQIKGDTIEASTPKKVNPAESTLITFISTTPGYYQTNNPIYGPFYPQISVTYKQKESAVSMRYDLSHKKWGAYNSSGDEICHFDMSDNNMLRISSIIFPTDTFLQTLLTIPEK